MNPEDAMMYAAQMPPARNFYQQAIEYNQGLKYRLDGDDVIDRVINELRGYRRDMEGKLKYFSEHRMMNEVGIGRVEAFLHAAVNKINHLTKYENENRVLLQVRSMARSFTIELVLNLKNWSPADRAKVPNWRLVVQIVENAILQSMQRAQDGFEAKNVTQQHSISEVISRPTPQSGLGGIFGNFFSRRPQQ